MNARSGDYEVKPRQGRDRANYKTEQGGASRAEYGSKLIENLSKYLTDTFGKGFSEANLKSMRSFYITYPEFDRQCLTNLSWSSVARIIRIDNPEERDYYLNEAASQNWSYRQLERNIKSGLLSQAFINARKITRYRKMFAGSN